MPKSAGKTSTRVANLVEELLRQAAAPSYQDYVDRKKKQGERPLSKEDWEKKVLNTGQSGDKKRLDDAKKLAPHIDSNSIDEAIQTVKKRLKNWDDIGSFMDTSKEDHEKALKMLEEAKSGESERSKSKDKDNSAEKIKTKALKDNVNRLFQKYPKLMDEPEYEALEKAYEKALGPNHPLVKGGKPKTKEERDKDFQEASDALKKLEKSVAKKKDKKASLVREDLLRMAHATPALRKHLVPLLRQET